jgi:hypothetical protein
MMTPDNVMHLMPQLELRFFRIFNASTYGLQYESMQEIPVSEAQKRFKEFFDMAGDGVYQVLMLRKPLVPGGSKPNKGAYEYEVVKSSTMQDPPRQQQPQNNYMNGFLEKQGGYMGAVDLTTHLAGKDEILLLKLQIQDKDHQIARLNDKIDDLKERHEKELKDAKNPQEIVKGIAPTIMGALNGLDLSKFMKS